MDDVERALDDGINTYKAITKEQRFVPGAGATEIELASQIHSFGEKAPGMSVPQPFPAQPPPSNLRRPTVFFSLS